jgi:hypothetical protein
MQGRGQDQVMADQEEEDPFATPRERGSVCANRATNGGSVGTGGSIFNNLSSHLILIFNVPFFKFLRHLT